MSRAGCIHVFTRDTKEKRKGDKCGKSTSGGTRFCSKHKPKIVQSLPARPEPQRLAQVVPENLVADELDEFGHEIFINWDVRPEAKQLRENISKQFNVLDAPPVEIIPQSPPVVKNKTTENEDTGENDEESVEGISEEYFEEARRGGISAKDIARFATYNFAGGYEKVLSLKNFRYELFNDPMFQQNFDAFLDETLSDRMLFSAGQACIGIAAMKTITCSTSDTPLIGFLNASEKIATGVDLVESLTEETPVDKPVAKPLPKPLPKPVAKPVAKPVTEPESPKFYSFINNETHKKKSSKDSDEDNEESEEELEDSEEDEDEISIISEEELQDSEQEEEEDYQKLAKIQKELASLKQLFSQGVTGPNPDNY